MNHPTDRMTHTTAFVTPVVEHWLEREIVQRVHSMKDRSDDPSHHERNMLPRSYISLPHRHENRLTLQCRNLQNDVLMLLDDYVWANEDDAVQHVGVC